MAEHHLLGYFNNLLYTFKVIFHHPLTSKRKLAATKRWLSWQIGSRLVPGAVAVPFVNQTRLLIKPRMHGATLNVYVGLDEFSEMSFLLHFLRSTDLFIDVGANVGAWTILASGAAGCHTIAFEPTREAFENLKANLNLNGIGELVECHPAALGGKRGKVKFTKKLDTLNHVVVSPQMSDVELTEVEVTTLDMELTQREPTLIKIDVEGYELSVISGGEETLGKPSLQAIIIEINEKCKRYGVEPEHIFESITDYGFTACRYDPRNRQLTEIKKEVWKELNETNTIFVRDIRASKDRVKAANSFRVLGHDI